MPPASIIFTNQRGRLPNEPGCAKSSISTRCCGRKPSIAPDEPGEKDLTAASTLLKPMDIGGTTAVGTVHLSGGRGGCFSSSVSNYLGVYSYPLNIMTLLPP